MTEYDTIQINHPSSQVAHLLLDRPQHLNTIDEATLAELEQAIDSLADTTTRVLVLSGAGDWGFCAGADITSFADCSSPLKAAALSERGQTVFGKLRTCSMPVIVGIDGPCLGGGMELAACADLCIAGDEAEFGQPEHELGILPGWGGTQRLRQLIGDRRAREVILTTDRYGPETMADYGFVNEVSTTPIDRALELADEIAQGPPLAHQATKRVMDIGLHNPTAGLQAEADAFGHLMTTEDAAEGIRAFLNDRSPEFDGL